MGSKATRAIITCCSFLLVSCLAVNVLYAQQESVSDTLVVKVLGSEECIDGIDNDVDGFIDYPDDTGCTSYDDNSEQIVAVAQCADGLDNDSDGHIDYPDDTGCESLEDNNEYTYSPPSGGGSSGGSSSGDGTTLLIQGNGYPNSTAFLVKDGQVVVSQKTESDGTFKIRYYDLASGHYTFALYMQDPDGRRASAQAFSANVEYDATTLVSGIYLPPTISIDKIQVKQGNKLTINGYSIPNATVKVSVGPNNLWSGVATSSGSGTWSLVFDTDVFGYGDYTVSAQTITSRITTAYSKSLAFKVGLSDIYNTALESCDIPVDLNTDCRVNLIDFSIAAFWYKKSNPLAHVDLNQDGIVNIKDFSILAYYWTG